MRSIRISPLIKWTLSIFLTVLVFMTLMRIGFFLYFKPLSQPSPDFINAFFLGLRYDLRTASCIVLPLLFAGSLHIELSVKNKLTAFSLARIIGFLMFGLLMFFLLKNNKGSLAALVSLVAVFILILVWVFMKKTCDPFKSNFAKAVWKTYFLSAIILLVFFYAIDFQHYDYLHQRLNASVLNYTEDAKISFGMVWQTYPVVKIFLVILIIISFLIWVINRSFKKIKLSSCNTNSPQRLHFFFVFLILAFFIFGRAGQYPLRWSDAFRFGDDFKASVSLNPVQSFFSTLQFRHSTYEEKKVRNYYGLVAKYLKINNLDSTHLNYTRSYQFDSVNNTKPNVVLVICESFSAYKSSMWGNPLNTTPYFNELCNQGIFFDHCFTPAYGTARGVWAVVTGIPDVESPNTASRNPAAVDQHSIINDFTNYKKLYFLGGSTSWANIRGLLTNNITELNLFEEGSYKAKAIDVWGISDKHLFLEANGVLKQQSSPFFAIIQTSDNHRPYTIPTEDINDFTKKNYPLDTLKKYGFDNNDELNAFRYTDFCYQKFMEAAKKENYFANTIFVFVGDHGIRGNAGNMFPQTWSQDGITTQHVPLLFYAPSLLQPQRLKKISSQLDILPSIASLIKVPYTNSTLGKNLFDTTGSGVKFLNNAFLFDPEEKKIGIITDTYCYFKNLLSGKEKFVSSIGNEELVITPSLQQDKNLLQNLVNAYYETARYMLLNNKKPLSKR